MPRYQTTICQDEGISKGMWFYAPIDMRKKFYFCDLCQRHHLVKDGVIKEKNKGIDAGFPVEIQVVK